jgi:hypothetical protein
MAEMWMFCWRFLVQLCPLYQASPYENAALWMSGSNATGAPQRWVAM